MCAAASVALIMTAVGSANAARWDRHGAGPHYGRSIHQSAGERGSRGLPEYHRRSPYDGAYGYAAPSGGTIPRSAIDFQEQGSR